MRECPGGTGESIPEGWMRECPEGQVRSCPGGAGERVPRGTGESVLGGTDSPSEDIVTHLCTVHEHRYAGTHTHTLSILHKNLSRMSPEQGYTAP